MLAPSVVARNKVYWPSPHLASSSALHGTQGGARGWGQNGCSEHGTQRGSSGSAGGLSARMMLDARGVWEQGVILEGKRCPVLLTT